MAGFIYRHRISAGALALSAILAAGLATAEEVLLPGDAAKGKGLYDAKCVGCHVSLVGGDGTALHTRPNRRVKTPEGLLSQVKMCNRQLDAGLNPDQIKDIVAYLYQAFYVKRKS